MNVVVLFALYLFFNLNNSFTFKVRLAKDKAILQAAHYVLNQEKLENDLKHFESLSKADLTKFRQTNLRTEKSVCTTWTSSTGKIRRIQQVSVAIHVDTLMHLGNLGNRELKGEFPFTFYKFTFSDGKTSTYLTQDKQGLLEYSIGTDKNSIGYETVDVASGIAYQQATKEISLVCKKEK
jgi:hypothetical protein